MVQSWSSSLSASAYPPTPPSPPTTIRKCPFGRRSDVASISKIDGEGPCWVSPAGLPLRPCRCQLLCVLGQGIGLSEPHFPHLDTDSRTCLAGLL